MSLLWNNLWPVLLVSFKNPPCPFTFVMIPEEQLAIYCSDSWEQAADSLKGKEGVDLSKILRFSSADLS